MSHRSPLEAGQEGMTLSDLRISNIGQHIDALAQRFGPRTALARELASAPSVRDFKRAMKKDEYTQLRRFKISRPAGLAVPFPMYIDVLGETVSQLDGIQKRVIKPLSMTVSRYVSQPETLQERGSARSIRDFKPMDVEGQLMKIADCFEAHERDRSVAFGDAFKRNKDVFSALAHTHDIVDDYIRNDPEQIAQATKDVYALVDRLDQRIDDDPDGLYQANPEQIDLLSKMLFTAAQEVELFGNVGFYLKQLVVAWQDTLDQLEAR